MSNILPNGLILLQVNPHFAVSLGAGGSYGFLYRKNNNNWVTDRKLANWEIMQAEDQRDCGHVINGSTARAG